MRVSDLGKGKPLPIDADPFYSDDNMARLRKAIADVESGKAKLTAHELIADDVDVDEAVMR